MNVNKNTLQIMQEENAVATLDTLTRGTGRYSRTANIPPFCTRVMRDAPLPSWITAEQAETVQQLFQLNPRRKYLVVADRVAVQKWLDDHPKSKLLVTPIKENTQPRPFSSSRLPVLEAFQNNQVETLLSFCATEDARQWLLSHPLTNLEQARKGSIWKKGDKEAPRPVTFLYCNAKGILKLITLD